jgi:uncharacterized membrane protein (UPF0127 family)
MTPQPQSLQEVTIEVKGKKLSVEAALTPNERAKGLMFRDSMPADHGMIFVYGKPQKMSFYMLNCRYPLDIAFIAEDGTIRQIGQMEPREEMPTRSQDEVKYALEMNKGWFERNRIGIGDKLKIGL